MALHEVQLKGYNVRPGNLSLGTFGSYGIEQLHVTLDDTWSGLAVTATFNPPKGEPREIRLPENGLIDVPAEATANEGTGTIVYCGVANRMAGRHAHELRQDAAAIHPPVQPDRKGRRAGHHCRG